MPPKRRPRNEDSKDHRGRCRNRYQRWKRSKSNDDPVPERVPDKRVRNQKHTAARIPDGHGRTNERSRSSLTSSSTQGQGQDASASNGILFFWKSISERHLILFRIYIQIVPFVVRSTKNKRFWIHYPTINSRDESSVSSFLD